MTFPETDTFYRVISKHYTCMDDWGGDTGPGSLALMRDDTAGSTHREFKLVTTDEEGWFRIVSTHNTCLDDWGGETGPNAAALQNDDYPNATNRKWKLVETNEAGWFRIVSKHNTCLDDWGGQTGQDYGGLQPDNSPNSDNRKWKFVSPNSDPTYKTPCEGQVLKIDRLVETFDAMRSGSDHKGTEFKLSVPDRASGSGIAGDLIAHQQGMYRTDNGEDSAGSFVVVGSAKENPGYFYIIKRGKQVKINGNKDYWEIDHKMTHPGGIQVADNILVIGNEQYSGFKTRSDRSNVRFYDIANESNVKELTHLQLDRSGDGRIASACGLTKLGDQWMLAVRGKDEMDFYYLVGDPRDSSKVFTFMNSLSLKHHGFRDFQCINLFVANSNNLFLFGMHDGKGGDDKCWLHRLEADRSSDGVSVTRIRAATQKGYKHFYTSGHYPQFKWASCVFFQPNNPNAQQGETVRGQFKVYAASAHVDGGKITCNEWL